MRILLVLTVTLSIIVAIMFAPAVLVICVCKAFGLSKIVMMIPLVPACVVGTLLGILVLLKIVDSEKFDKLLG